MIFNYNIGFIGVNFYICMYCETRKDCDTLSFNNRLWFMFIPVFMVWGSVMLADLPIDVLTDSVMSVFIFSRTYYRTARNLVVHSFIIIITHSTFGINPVFYYSGLVIPGVEVLVLCSHDKSLCFSFQTHTTKSLIGACLVNTTLLTSS